MKTWWIRKVAGFLVIAALSLFVLGWVVMLLWNAILPDVLHASAITYWQAVGLLLLTHILFRGVGRWGHRKSSWKNHYWKHRFEEKLAAMTPEERDQFKAEWKKRCGWEPGEEKTASSER